MLWNFIKSILGSYLGPQRTKQIKSIVDAQPGATVENELQIPAVWQCINLIVNTFKCLPIDVLKVDDDGKKTLDKSHYLYTLLNYQPNQEMTPSEFKSVMCLNYLLTGNAYALINRSAGGNYVLSIYPLASEQVQVVREKGRVIRYEYLDENNEKRIYKPKDILHWKGIGNGITGLSVKDFAKSTLSEAVSAQNAAVDVFRNKGKLHGILTADNFMDKAQIKSFSETYDKMKSVSGIPIIPSSFHYQQLSLSPAETQLLDTRKYNAQDFARWYNVPPVLLTGDGDLTEALRFFYKVQMLPLCTSFEEVLFKALDPSEWTQYEIKCELSKVNRASDTERAQLNATYVQNGIKTRNEVRREEGLKDMEGGDKLTAQTNLAPVEQLGTENYDPSQTSQTSLTTQPVKQ